MVINKSTTELIGELIDVEQELAITKDSERQDELEEEVKGFLLKMERYLRVLKMTSPNWLGHIQLQQERRQKGEGRIRCYDFGISYL